MITIDSEKLEAFLKGKNLGEVSASIGKSSGYIGNLRTRLKMPAATFWLLCRVYGLRESDLLPPPPKPKPSVPAAPNTAQPNRRAGYWLDLADNGDHVLLRLMYDDEEAYKAKARVKGGQTAKELDFIQAVIYAAHMLYKLAEQDDMGG